MQSVFANKKVTLVAFFACFLGFIGLLGSDLYLPAMPSMQQFFHTTVAHIELSVAIYMIGFGIAPLLFGPMSDRFGRKKVVISGVTIAVIGTIIAIMSNNIHMFLVARAIQGCGAGATLSMFRVILRDVVHGKQMAVLASYATMTFNVSPLLGMVLGGYLVHYFSWHACFIALLIVYVFFIAVFAAFCPETLQERSEFHRKAIISGYGRVLSDAKLLAISLCSGLALSVVYAFATAGPFIFQHYLHLSAISFGWIGIALSIASIVFKFVNAKCSMHFALDKIMLSGIALVAVAGLLLLLLNFNVVNAILSICLASGATAFILSNAMTIGMHHYAKDIGYAASLYGSIQILTVFLTNAVLANLNMFGISSLAVFYIVIAVLALLTLRIALRKGNGQEDGKSASS